MIELIPVKEHIEENKIFSENPDCHENVRMTVEFYKKVGFTVPWICYYAQSEMQFIGCAGFKGKPVNGKVEIAYGVFPQYYNKGIGTKIAATLVELSLKTDPAVIITARTLPEENYSARILRKNNFKLLGLVMDDEDGEVWEWEHVKDPI